MSNDFPKVKVGNLGYQEDITTATLKNQPEPEKIHLEKEKHLEIINFGVPCLFFQVWDHPSPLWHRKRSPRGVAFGCSTRCAKSTNFGCECGSIGNWRRERKQHIFVNAVNAKVAWIRIEWLIEWRIEWMIHWILMDNFPYEWTWHHILCEICEWARRHVAMCCVRSYHYISIARVSKNATAFIEAFLLSWQAGCLEVEQSSGSTKWFLFGRETDLDMNFPQNSVSEGKKPWISNINFQHKFLNLSLLPYYNSFRQTESLLQPWALLRGLRENQPLQAWHGCNQPTNMGKAGSQKFLENVQIGNPKRWRWMVQTIFLPLQFTSMLIFREVHAQGFYLPTNGPLNLVNPSMPGMSGVSPWQQERWKNPLSVLGVAMKNPTGLGGFQG